MLMACIMSPCQTRETALCSIWWNPVSQATSRSDCSCVQSATSASTGSKENKNGSGICVNIDLTSVTSALRPLMTKVGGTWCGLRFHQHPDGSTLCLYWYKYLYICNTICLNLHEIVFICLVYIPFKGPLRPHFGCVPLLNYMFYCKVIVSFWTVW